jgi:hypothetical protein
MNKMITKGQAILEFVLVFIIITFLVMGLLGLWRWSHDLIPAREVWFEGTRIEAGKKDSPGVPEVIGNPEPPPDPSYL